MIFGQLSNRDSLSDLILCLQSQQNKSYHLGMVSGTSKVNLAKAMRKGITEFMNLLLQYWLVIIVKHELKLKQTQYEYYKF